MDGPQRILLVDDDPDIVAIYQELLRRLPSAPEVCTADSGPRALGLLESEPFSVLIIDLGLPKMDGFEVITLARRRLPDLPVVVLTGLSDGELPERAASLGVQLFQQKASSSEELKSFLKQVDALLMRVGQVRRPATTADRSPASGPRPERDRSRALYPFIMGGLLHNAMNTLASLNGQLELAARVQSPAAPDPKSAARLRASVSHLGAFLRLMQHISQGFYAPAPEAAPVEEIRRFVQAFPEQEPDIAFDLRVDPAIDGVAIPAGLLTFVVGELLKNATAACRQRPASRVSLSVCDDPREQLVSIECTDNGRGFPLELVSAVCEERLRAPAPPAAGGYGLYLVNELATRLKGQLLVSNLESGGARVHVLLPYHLNAD